MRLPIPLRLRTVRPAERSVALAVLALAACSSTSPAAARRRPGPPSAALAATAPERDGGAADAVPGADAALDSDAGLLDYLRRAELENAGLQAAWSDWTAALERVPQVASLPDPVLRYRYFLEEVETRVGPQEQAFGLAQRIPWLSELARAGDVAAAEADAARMRFEALRQDVRAEVCAAYAEACYLARATEVVRRNRDLIADLERVARARYSAGAARHPDVIRAQLELDVLEDRLRSLEDRRAPAAARLNAVLQRPAGAELAWPRVLVRASLASDDADVLARVLERNPELRGLDFATAREEHAVAEARAAAWPDFEVGVEYIDTGSAVAPGVPGSGDDPLAVTLGLTLPIQVERYDAQEREARARLRAARKRRESLAVELEARAVGVLYRVRDAERRAALYADALIPKAQQALAATETAYRAGEADFLDLVDAEKLLLELELSLERTRADHALELAELERLAGGALPGQSEGTRAEEKP